MYGVDVCCVVWYCVVLYWGVARARGDLRGKCERRMAGCWEMVMDEERYDLVLCGVCVM